MGEVRVREVRLRMKSQPHESFQRSMYWDQQSWQGPLPLDATPTNLRRVVA